MSRMHISQLPPELLVNILRLGDQQDKINAETVCKAWLSACRLNRIALWQNVDLQLMRKSVAHGHGVQTLPLDVSAIINWLLSRISGVEALRIGGLDRAHRREGSTKLKDFTVHVAALLTTAPRLSTLSLTDCGNTNGALCSILRSLPHLQHLANLEVIGIDSEKEMKALSKALHAGLKLTSLHLSCASGAKLHDSLAALTSLQTLRLSLLEGRRLPRQLQDSLSALHGLMSLRLENNAAAEFPFTAAFGSLSRLQSLHLQVDMTDGDDTQDEDRPSLSHFMQSLAAGNEVREPHLRKQLATLQHLDLLVEVGTSDAWAPALSRLQLTGLSLLSVEGDITAAVEQTAGLGLQQLDIWQAVCEDEGEDLLLPAGGKWQQLTRLHFVCDHAAGVPAALDTATALRDLALSCTPEILSGKINMHLLALPHLTDLQLVINEEDEPLTVELLRLAVQLQSQLTVARPWLLLQFWSLEEWHDRTDD